MGLFGFNYNKPGPGVREEDVPKEGIPLYFDIIRHRFFKLVGLNFLYFLVSLPAVIVYFYLSNAALYPVFEKIKVDIADENMAVWTMFFLCSIMISLILTFAGTGPANAGTSYVLSAYVRHKHSWVVSDFFKSIKDNLLNSILIFLLDAFFLFIIILDMNFYAKSLADSSFIVNTLMLMMLLAYLIYILMHFWMYLLMVTYKMKFFDIIKMSFYLAIDNFLINLLLILAGLGLNIIFFSIIYYAGLRFYVLLVALLYTFFQLLGAVFIYPKIMKKVSGYEFKIDEV